MELSFQIIVLWLKDLKSWNLGKPLFDRSKSSTSQEKWLVNIVWTNHMTEMADVPSKRASTENVKSKYNNYCNSEMHGVDFPDQHLLYYTVIRNSQWPQVEEDIAWLQKIEGWGTGGWERAMAEREWTDNETLVKVDRDASSHLPWIIIPAQQKYTWYIKWVR